MIPFGWHKICRMRSICVALVYLVALLRTAAIAQTQNAIFPVTPLYNVSIANTVAAGDFNGDGRPDAAYLSPVSGSSPTLTVLLNNGPGATPTPVVSKIPCDSFVSMATGDLNHDSKLDLVVGCINNVIVLLGNGDGTFQTPAQYPIQDNPPEPNFSQGAIAQLIDLDGDGYLDVVAAGFQTSGPIIEVLLNKGSAAPGTLETAKSYPSGFPVNSGALSISQIAGGDFNGDGRQDVLVGASPNAFGPQGTSPEVEIFYGNGDGTLQTDQKLAFSAPFVAADLNNDGITDIAWLSTNSSTLATSLQTALGSANGLNIAPPQPLPDSATYYGTLSNLGTNPENNEVNLAILGEGLSILRGNGDGTFVLGESYPYAAQSIAAAKSSDGTESIVLYDGEYVQLLNENSNGSFPGPVGIPTWEPSYSAADVNGDGLTDVLFWDGAANLVAGLARGDGTFDITHQAADPDAQLIVPGDFNGDGNIDAVAINYGNNSSGSQPSDALLYFYQGNGDGSFKARTAAVDLHNYVAQNAAAGDFNGDGKLDLLISFVSVGLGAQGTSISLDLLLGNGDGSFAAPVRLSQETSLYEGGPIYVADLNNDRKLDILWNDIVFLGKGDGTFKQSNLGIDSAPYFPLAVADLNGDGILDLVIQGANFNGLPSLFAGNGDGTFQSTPFYSAVTPSSCADINPYAAATGDINGDGVPDLLLPCGADADGGGPFGAVVAYLGKGKGSFVADPNIYFTGTVGLQSNLPMLLTRLNRNAPKLPVDNTLDLLTFTGTGATSVLNQNNPIPTIRAATGTTLTTSATTIDQNQQLTLTALVSGNNPTGSVAFVYGSTTIGTTSSTGGKASLSTTFATAGTFEVSASYSGDNSYLPNISAPISITVSAPQPPGLVLGGTNVSVSPGAITSNTSTITVTPTNGFTGSVTLTASITASPNGAVNLPTLSFGSTSPVKITSTSAQTATLTVTTTGPTSNFRARASKSGKPRLGRWFAAGGTALACVLLFGVPARRRNWAVRICLLAALALLSGTVFACGGGSDNTGGGGNPGTTPGGYTATITATSGSITATNTITITIQ